MNDILGWMSSKELEWLSEQSKYMSSIVELGSYRGRSTSALLSGCKGTVYAVDKFNDEEYHPLPGYTVPTTNSMLEDFKSNVGHHKNLQIVQMDTVEASKYLPDVDMVFIDSSHEYEHTLSELKAWNPKTRKLICGHDYPGWPGVERSVNEFFGQLPLTIDSIWYFMKDSSIKN